jgi:ribulose-phosphate 3-epimerase
MSKPMIAPSLLAADFANLQKEVEMLNQSEADLIHLDVMDGAFVPNISFGMPVISAVKKHAKKPLDVHLMIDDADNYIEDFKKVGADWISVHYEACAHLHRTIQSIKAAGCKAGVVLNPHTSVELIENLIPDLDFVLLMSVNPGFGGQKFIPFVISKVHKLKQKIQELNPSCLIEVDGGVNSENAPDLVKAGADILVAGSFVFKADNPEKVISDLKNIPTGSIVA